MSSHQVVTTMLKFFVDNPLDSMFSIELVVVNAFDRSAMKDPTLCGPGVANGDCFVGLVLSVCSKQNFAHLSSVAIMCVSGTNLRCITTNTLKLNVGLERKRSSRFWCEERQELSLSRINIKHLST